MHKLQRRNSSGDPTKGVWRYELRWRFSDGTEHTLNGNALFDDVVPAKPGYEFLAVTGSLGDYSLRIQRQPVLAWRVRSDPNNGAEPIVQNDLLLGLAFTGVLQPDGRVYSRGGWYSSEAAYIKSIRPECLRKKKELSLRDRAPKLSVVPRLQTTIMDDDPLPWE